MLSKLGNLLKILLGKPEQELEVEAQNVQGLKN